MKNWIIPGAIGLVVVFLGWLIYFFVINSPSNPQFPAQTNQQPNTNFQTSQVATTTNPTANSQLDQDLQNISSKLKGLSNQSASVDQSLNDKAVYLGE